MATGSAPLQQRVLAGVIDGFALAALAAAIVGVQFATAQVVFPMWSALAAVFGYAALPGWLLRGTLGLRLQGLEIVRTDGEAPDPFVLFIRELLGRGLLALAYLGTVLFGLVGFFAFHMQIFAPSAMGLWGALAMAGLLTLSIAGQVLVLAREDGRGLPDLLAGTLVRVAQPQSELTDEERWMRDGARRRARGIFAVGELLLFGAALGGPIWVMREPGPDDTVQRRLDKGDREEAEASFNADPSDPSAEHRLLALLDPEKDAQQIEAVRSRYAEARKGAEAAQEKGLVALVQQNPHNLDTLLELVGFYDQRGRRDDASKAYVAFVEANPEDPCNRAQYGVWLFDADRNTQAVETLQKAIASGCDEGFAYEYLGWSQMELGQKQQARANLRLALARDPSLERGREDLEALEAELGPEPKAKKPKK